MLFFLLMQAGVVVWFRSGRLGDPYYTYRAAALRAHLQNMPEDDAYRVVLLGSSRIHQGLAGKVIEGSVAAERHRPCLAFNFAMPSGGPITSRLYLQRLLEENCRPDLVLIEIYPLTLTAVEDRPAETASLYPERIRPDEIPLLSAYGFDADAIRERHRQVVFNPWKHLRFELLERVQYRLIPSKAFVRWCHTFDRWGGRPIAPAEMPLELREKRVVSRVNNGLHSNDSWAPSPHARQAFSDLLAYCRMERIQVILVYMPDSSELRAQYSLKAQENIRQYAETLQTEWQVPVVFMRDWLPDSAFYDTVHLYAGPAEELTKRLCREFLLPYLQQNSPYAPRRNGEIN